MNHRQRQQGLALGVLVSRIDTLERRLAAGEARERVLRERVDTLSASLHMLWRKYESRGAARRPAQLETSTAPSAEPRSIEPRRVPAIHAARRLGVTPQTVRRLVEAGDLEGLALPMPESSRRLWVVSLESLERFERAAGDAVGAPDTEKQAEARRLGHSKGR